MKKTFVLKIQVDVVISDDLLKGVDEEDMIEEFINEIEYEIESRTEGVKILDTTILDYDSYDENEVSKDLHSRWG